MFGFLKDISLEVLWAIEERSRDTAQLTLKMELFIAGYPDSVVFSAIPSSSYLQGYPDSGRFTAFYVRLVHASGVTSFNWFMSESTAQMFADDCAAGKKGGVTKVVGPHKLPKGNGARFR